MKAEAVDTMETPAAQADDAALLQAFRSRNDRQAMNALLQRHADAAYRTALRLCRNSADAEDAVQSAFIEVLRRSAQFRGESAVKPWLLGFVVNACRHKAREEGRRDVREGKAAVPETVLPSEHAPDREAVRAAVQELPEHYRAPVWLHYCEGLSSGEVAQALSLSENTVRSQLSRAVEQLRNALAVGTPALLAGLAGVAVESAPATLTSSISTLAAPAALQAGAAAKMAAGTVAFAAVLSTAAFIGWGGVQNDPLPPDLEVVERKVREWQPRPEERRFDEIAWAKDIGEAVRLSKQSGRPVFVLAHGSHVNTGRSDGGSMGFREGPLADPRTIALLNRRFVPVYSCSQDPSDLEHQRVYREALQKKIVAGSECIYFLGTDGHAIDSMHVCNTKITDLLPKLEQLAGPEGAPLVAPSPQSVAPPAEPGSLVLHFTCRYLTKDGAVEEKRGNYHMFPGEDWLVLRPADAARLLPADLSRKGAGQNVDSGIASQILERLYPLTGNFRDASTNRMEERSLTARVAAVSAGTSWIRLDGRVTLTHPFFPERDPRPVEAGLVGFLKVDVASRRILSARIATSQATYGAERFGVAVRSAD